MALIVTGCIGGGGGGGSGGTPSGTTATTGSLKVTNTTGQAIYYLYVSPANSGVWGSDQLGSSIIANNASFTVNSIPTGSYDVKAVLADGTALYRYAQTISANMTTTVTFGGGTGGGGTLRITNMAASGSTVTQFYLSTSTANWGSNQLGGATIAYGATFNLTNIPAGSYYAKAVLANGATGTSTAPFSITAGTTTNFTIN